MENSSFINQYGSFLTGRKRTATDASIGLSDFKCLKRRKPHLYLHSFSFSTHSPDCGETDSFASCIKPKGKPVTPTIRVYRARRYVNDCIQEFHDLSTEQLTIPTINGKYKHVLSKDGIQLYKEVLYRVAIDDFDKTLDTVYYSFTDSGRTQLPAFTLGTSNRSDNVIAKGYPVKPASCDNVLDITSPEGSVSAETIRTDTCIFHNEHWCYTIRGMLYKIKNVGDNSDIYGKDL